VSRTKRNRSNLSQISRPLHHHKYIWYKSNHFLAALRVELRAPHLLKKHSTTFTTIPDSKKSFILFIFILLVMFFCSIGAWIQGLVLDKQALSLEPCLQSSLYFLWNVPKHISELILALCLLLCLTNKLSRSLPWCVLKFSFATAPWA
jgi:hypothetical protein